MINYNVFLLIIWTALSLLSFNINAGKNEKQRIITAGNGVTEIVYALGAGDEVVGVDSTSNYPKKTEGLPNVGYYRQLSAEGILKLNPTILIGTTQIGFPATLTQLKQAKLPIVTVPVDYSIKSIKERITLIGQSINKIEEANHLLKSLDRALTDIDSIAKGKKPKVLFLLMIGGRITVAGDKTSANLLLQLAGGDNPAVNLFNGYKAITPESLLNIQPDIILYTGDNTKDSTKIILKKLPVLTQTPAGRNHRFIHIDSGLLLGGLGPRSVNAGLKLAKKFYQR